MDLSIQPTNLQEYQARYKANQQTVGNGPQVTCHAPCPFCAAPDFMIFKMIDYEAAMSTGGRCKECSRSAKFKTKGHPGSVSIELVQTDGPTPKMRVDHVS
jgi:hypothetical protein